MEKYSQIIFDFNMNVTQNFPWVVLCHTLHATIHHSEELMKDNGDIGLGMFSEEPLEATNKDVRNYLRDLSRKNDPSSQMEDVITRLLERSHPSVHNDICSLFLKPSCSVCGSAEHTARSHGKNIYPTMEYDSIVESFFQ